MSDLIADAIREHWGELCEHETFKDVCGICHRDGVITGLRAENERLREEAEFGYMTGFDVAKSQYCTMVQKLEDENERLRAALKEMLNLPYGSENYYRVIARGVLDGQPAPGKEEA